MADETNSGEISQESLVKALRRLSPEQRQALLAAPTPQSTTPKLSPAIDAIPDDEVKAVVEACKRGLAAAKEQGPESQDEAEQLAPLADVAPSVAAAARTNSIYRRKPLTHSLQQVVQRLTDKGRVR